MLDEGRTICDVIVALERHPAIARAIAREWADLRGALIIGGETLARFPTFPCMFFAEPVRTEADLIEALETADVQHCALCERNAPTFASTASCTVTASSSRSQRRSRPERRLASTSATGDAAGGGAEVRARRSVARHGRRKDARPSAE